MCSRGCCDRRQFTDSSWGVHKLIVYFSSVIFGGGISIDPRVPVYFRFRKSGEAESEMDRRSQVQPTTCLLFHIMELISGVSSKVGALWFIQFVNLLLIQFFFSFIFIYTIFTRRYNTKTKTILTHNTIE